MSTSAASCRSTTTTGRPLESVSRVTLPKFIGAAVRTAAGASRSSVASAAA
jgi:hypothetical protein